VDIDLGTAKSRRKGTMATVRVEQTDGERNVGNLWNKRVYNQTQSEKHINQMGTATT